MGTSENFCLRWNDFETNVSGSFRQLRAESEFFDVTLACDDSLGRPLKAHKLILSACSSFFKQMLRNMSNVAPGSQSSIIYLRGVKYNDLQSVLDFMYQGEVNVAQNDLNSFLAVAEDLQIKGLTQHTSKDIGKKGFNKRASASTTGPSSKRSRRGRPSASNQPEEEDEEPEDENDEIINIKHEPTGFDGAPSTSGEVEGSGFDVGTAGSSGAGTSGAGAYDNTFDDSYTYAEGGGTDEGLMDHNLEGEVEGDNSKGITDLNELVLGLLTYSEGTHTCNLCGKKSPWRTTMLRHVEANHVETAGHVCDICGQVSKTRHAFAMHKKRKHQVNIANEPLPTRQSSQASRNQQEQQQQSNQQETIVVQQSGIIG